MHIECQQQLNRLTQGNEYTQEPMHVTLAKWSRSPLPVSSYLQHPTNDVEPVQLP